jgi:hypothetical protein
MFFTEYNVRLRGVDALRCLMLGSDPQVDLIELGGELMRLGERLESPASSDFTAWGELLRAVGYLVRWSSAIREAEMDSDRHLRAAKQRAQDILRRSSEGTAIHGAATAIVNAGKPEDLPTAAIALLRVQLPLPFPAVSQAGGGSHPVSVSYQAPTSEPMLAFLQFYLGDQEVIEPHDLRPNVLYDLRIELQLSEVPDNMKLVEVTPYTVEPGGAIDAPMYLLEVTDGCSVFSGIGRLCIRVAHDALARPLEISYGAQATFRDNEESLSIKVQGQSKLQFRCIDENYLWRGNRSIQDAILRVRDSARRLGLPDSELSKFLELLGAVGVIAAESLANNIFTGEWPEERFHASIRSRIRSDASIGSALEDHPHVSGGVSDLSFHRIRLELKVDLRPLSIEDAFEMYGQQLAQYVVGSDRRSGVLVVLCGVKERVAPGSIENDIGLRVVSPPTGGDRGVAIGVVLIRTNLSAPSSLSRR